MLVEKSPVEEEPEVPMISEIPEEQVTSEKGYYHGVYVIMHFNNPYGVGSKKEQSDLEKDPDEEQMEDVKIDDER